MKDKIDERNFREQSSRSIVKGYNIRYVTEDELAKQEELNKQNMAQQTEVQPNKTEVPKFRDEEENELHYGENKPTDPVTQEQIAKILGEREEQHMSMLHEQLGSKE